MPERKKKADAAERIKKLRKEIEHHRYLYHVLDTQEISDAALDSLKHELSVLEREHPDLVTPDSPTQRVGGVARKEFTQVRHEAPMLSLEDIFSEEELAAWEERNTKRLKTHTSFEYFCEVKIDGMAVELVYENGVLKQASTRGDGTIGEDVTENVKTIESIPLRLRGNVPRHLVVRGEIYMTKKNFAALNAAQKKAGKPLFANPRNVSAGSIRQLDPRMTASRTLSCIVYDIVTDTSFATHEEEHAAAKAMGFAVDRHSVRVHTQAEVRDFHTTIAQQREKLPYWIDGVVVSVNTNTVFRNLGIVGKSPRGSVAFKFPAEEATTVVEDILVQVGRTGALTPVAVLALVQLAGTTVKRATLHNEDEVHRKDVRIGDTVILRKAGDIIPEVVSVLQNLRPKKTKTFSMPKKCPICNSSVERIVRGGKKQDAGSIHRCTNRRCAAQQARTIRHFVTRAAADIEGIGPKLIEKLLESGIIRTAADLYTLSRDDITALERYAEKSADNIVASIRGRRTLPLGRFLYALGILHVGNVTAQDIANHFRTLARIQRASLHDMMQVNGIGDVVAASVVDYFHDPKTTDLLEAFQKAGVRVTAAQKTEGMFSGKTLVVTGSLDGVSREDAWAFIRAEGGAVSESVGKKTSLVIVGDDAGSKKAKAEVLGLPLMSKDEFLRLVGNTKTR